MMIAINYHVTERSEVSEQTNQGEKNAREKI